MSDQQGLSDWPKILILITVFSLFLAVVDYLFQLAGGVITVLFFNSISLTILIRFLVSFLTMVMVIIIIKKKGFM